MTWKPLLLFATLIITGATSFAQQRVCDMSITLVSPADGSTINANAQYNISVALLNNGPNDLLIGDTLYYNTPMIPSFSLKPYVLQQNIPFGGTATIVLESANNNNTNTIDVTESYCIKVLGNQQHVGTFIDTMNLTNNISCNQVTLKASNPTAIKNVVATTEYLSFYPNPTQGRDITVNFESYKPQDVTIFVRDITGKVLLQKDIKKVPVSNNTFAISVGTLANGLYLLELRTDDRKATGKLVIR